LNKKTVIDLCCDPYCMNEATQSATPPGVDGLRLLLCDKHAGRFVRLANKRNIPLNELGLAPIPESAQ
jgi:hypothetical protein